MTKFVAMDLNEDQVREFTNDLYQIDSMWQNTVTITPERDKCVPQNKCDKCIHCDKCIYQEKHEKRISRLKRITFEITITPMNEEIFNYMLKHVISSFKVPFKILETSVTITAIQKEKP